MDEVQQYIILGLGLIFIYNTCLMKKHHAEKVSNFLAQLGEQ